MDGGCVACSPGNRKHVTAETPDGNLEYTISGVCEDCFDENGKFKVCDNLKRWLELWLTVCRTGKVLFVNAKQLPQFSDFNIAVDSKKT